MARRHLATCVICEAACGIVVEVDEAGRVASVRGDDDDPQSRGYVCPKVVGMADLHHDPDRLRRPLVREGGELREASWDEAIARAAEGIRRVRRAYGPDAVAGYTGNPTAHNLGLMTHAVPFLRSLGSRNLYSASSADQLPHMRAAHEMFGHAFLLPVPDVDRTKLLLVVGANPAVSNGSVLTAPDMKRRIRAIRERGGRVVVVDPRRTETAELADQHLFLRPGTDAAFALSLASVIFEERLERPGRLWAMGEGWGELRRAASLFSPESVEHATGVPAAEARSLARELARSPSAAIYGRLGTCHQPFATLASWALYALSAITGNLDRPGGSMWATPAADVTVIADLLGMHGAGRWKSRVRGLSEVLGELPVATLADEIETPGPGQIKAMVIAAGNPALSAPNGPRVERALASLEHLVSVDGYLNETSRHAHVILPPVSALQRSHYDLALSAFAARNGARYAEPVLARGSDERHDWEIFAELAALVHAGPGLAGRALARAALALRPEAVVDLALRAGPHRLSLSELRRRPHGVDLGPLEPRLPRLLRTPRHKVRLAPGAFVDELPLLRGFVSEQAEAQRQGGLLLIGRRQLRSNNSWLHNSERLVKGPRRCTLIVHPDDAGRLGLKQGELAEVCSAAGRAVFPVDISDEMMPGVASAPHGWGHDRGGTRLRVASASAGVSVNDVTDEGLVDRLSGNAAFSGVRVRVRPAGQV